MTVTNRDHRSFSLVEETYQEGRDGKTAKGPTPCVDGGGAEDADGRRSRRERAGGPGGPGQSAACGGPGVQLHCGGGVRRTPFGAWRGYVGGPLQPDWPCGLRQPPWRWPAEPVWARRAGAHSAGVPSLTRSRTGRHRDLVADHPATGAATRPRWLAQGEHLDHPADPVGSRVHLAAEPHMVPDGNGAAQAQTRDGDRHRPGCHRKKGLIEQAYRLGEALGLPVWCEDEAGPYQAVPQPGRSWQPQGEPARQPHEYIRGGTAKLLTLFRPATGEVRAPTGSGSAQRGPASLAAAG